MDETLSVHIEGIGWWSPQWPDWASAERHLRGEIETAPANATKPTAAILAPGERRRAPDLVLLACEVAAQACAAAERAPAELPCVFASMHGDVGTADAICATLARAPHEVSPTRFHNSVHNASAGYWTVATGCREASTALAAGAGSFAAGLLEAALEACAEGRPVLFAAYEVGASGPLAEAVHAQRTLGAAFVLNTERDDARTRSTLRLRCEASSTPTESDASAVALALPLLRALARKQAATLRLPAGAANSLLVEVCP